MALCPQCDHSVLVHTLLTDNLAGYSCGKCLGTLVSLVAYRAWRERSARGRASGRRRPPNPTSSPPDSIGAKKCPKCRSLMSKYRIRSDKTNRLDYCPHCEEIWLDEGEWQLVEGLVASGEFTKVFTQAWQYAVRAGDDLRHGRAAAARVVRRRLRARGAVRRVVAVAAGEAGNPREARRDRRADAHNGKHCPGAHAPLRKTPAKWAAFSRTGSDTRLSSRRERPASTGARDPGGRLRALSRARCRLP